MVRRLVGEAEAKEVESERGAPADQIEDLAPVIGAGGEAVEEEQRCPGACRFGDEDPPSAEFLVAAPLAPRLDPAGEGHARAVGTGSASSRTSSRARSRSALRCSSSVSSRG